MRRAAREFVLQHIFEYFFSKSLGELADDDEFAKFSAADKEYIINTLNGCVEKYDDINKIISEHTKKFDIERLFKIDLAIVILATYEMQSESVPASIAINEAVTLAKKYGNDKSSKFVNGILGVIFKEAEEKHGQL